MLMKTLVDNEKIKSLIKISTHTVQHAYSKRVVENASNQVVYVMISINFISFGFFLRHLNRHVSTSGSTYMYIYLHRYVDI